VQWHLELTLIMRLLHQLTLAQQKSAMMVFAVLLMHAIPQMDNAHSLLITIDAVITTNAPSIDVQQLDVPILLLFVTMVMHAQAINVIPELENVFTHQLLPRTLIFAPSKLVMQRMESSTLQRTVMMVLLALLIVAILTSVAPTLQTMVVVMMEILALLIPVFKERDVSTLQ
jgi:hypothetical protein